MKPLRMIAALAASVLFTQPVSAADSYPSKPVRIIVPYQAGQGTDVAARYLGEYLARSMGQPFIVENRPGAGGNIGASEAARAAPDGYTLLMGTNGTHVLNQYIYASTNFDPAKDFAPIMLVSSFPMVLLTAPGSPYNSLSDLQDAAKSKADSVNVGMPSTTARLVFELLKQQGVASIRGIPYKGSATATTDLMGGQVQLGIDTVSAARSFITSGKLRALAVTSLKESALLPGVKPVSAQGLPDFQVIAWNGLYAPKGTPPAVVQKLNAELAKALAQPEVRQRLLELGHEPGGGTPAELEAFARSERLKWQPLIIQAGLKAE
ncbi:tripartite tricarboxylate transporter substrate binding protein [Achromobacter sp. LC458]|uniref:Bug family tripartite tricarboxylate transporter substrate binding protein n=1 Tax=unclassified Achromobacter TaxID=2626865 RepID=UPI00062A3594|nr:MULTISPECIES: tripartite tricarboxylate transporter substrate binding protein [unclassified Achromobacter]MDX3987729.1 tripartite tricarboxylate transporter substrate binding protein [Achromobacter sp.]QYJ21000.1 tripartite tricarboxylate transporter substrate binding protein [Achromobacter sp. ES-001]TRM50609.1 tripartite tricarboxylate transporter substrate binding protein [Achromobacter sp. LC458]